MMFGGQYLSYSTQILIFISTLISIYMIIFLSRAYALYDQPRESRFHKTPTPRIGGIVLFFIPLFFLVTVLSGNSFWGPLNQKSVLQILALTTVYLGGAWDDFKPTNSALNKLIVQLIACILATISFNQGFIASLLIFLIILFMVNSMNLMDNMNGLSAGLSLIVLGYFLYLGDKLNHQPDYFQIYIVLFISLLGFFAVNFFAGKIFMGDQGSQLLGMVLPLIFFNLIEQQIISLNENLNLTLLIQMLLASFFIFLPFVYDTFSVIYLRIKQGKPIYVGDTQHLSHRIVKRGNHPMVAVVYIFIFQLLAIIFAHYVMSFWVLA